MEYCMSFEIKLSCKVSINFSHRVMICRMPESDQTPFNHLLSSVFWIKSFFGWSSSFNSVIYDWINNPTRTFSKRFLYVWHNSTIDWFKYIINVTVMNNCFSLWIKSAIFRFIITFFFKKTLKLMLSQT